MMTVGLYTCFRHGDPTHYLHGASLVRDVRREMPGVAVAHLTDADSPSLPWVDRVERLPAGPLLERRIEHYAAHDGDWLFLDTDIELCGDVRGVFADPYFDVALTDRDWPHLTQPARLIEEMPYNTGVVFSRSRAFWSEVLATWRDGSPDQRADWLSEQRAVAHVARSGRYRVRVLSGMAYNYPPSSGDDPRWAAIRHYKGRRKVWLTRRIYTAARQAQMVPACV